MTTDTLSTPISGPTTVTDSHNASAALKSKKASGKTAALKVSKTSTAKMATKTSHKPSTHPTYSEMIAAALTSLKERNGSSRYAIVKYIIANYDVGQDTKVVNAHVKASLKRSITDGAVKQTKGIGASGSFRIGEKKVDKKVKKINPTSSMKSKSKKLVKPKTTPIPKVKKAIKPATIPTKKKIVKKVRPTEPKTKVTKKTSKPASAKPKATPAKKIVKKTTTTTKKTQAKTSTK